MMEAIRRALAMEEEHMFFQGSSIQIPEPTSSTPFYTPPITPTDVGPTTPFTAGPVGTQVVATATGAPSTTTVVQGTKRLTKEEEAYRRKNMCFKCNGKWGPDHTCAIKGKLFLIVDVDDEDDIGVDTGWQGRKLIEEAQDAPQISLNALTGISTLQTMRTHVLLKGVKVTTLIDSGSTHNFVDMRLVKHLQLMADPNSKFVVQVANGETVESQGKCETVPLQFPNVITPVDVLLLRLIGCDLVLGVQWFVL